MLNDGVGCGGGSLSSKLAFSLEVKYDGVDAGGVGSSWSKLLLDDGASNDFVGDGDENFDGLDEGDDGGSSAS